MGLEKGEGCVDMIFTARQLVEKSREHTTPLFVLFVDLRKKRSVAGPGEVWYSS